MNPNDLNFQKIYEDFYPKIRRYVTRLAGEADAEDLTQDVFIKVSAALTNFRGESQLSTWIYRIATNATLDWLRSSNSKQTVQTCSSNFEDGETEITDQNTWTGEKTPLVEHQVFRKEMNNCIQGYINSLPEDYRTVLLLNEFENLSDNEIAEILGDSVGAVKIRLHRARERLKKKLIQNCDSDWIEENEFIPELKSFDL